MRKNLYIIALLAISMIFPVQAQVTGLSDVRLYIDPGHSRQENMGVSGWSEAETVLRVSLALEEFLLAHTDMRPENIRLSRRDDNVLVGLAARTNEANAFGADFLVSIHSDASSNQAVQTTLFLYPGMRFVANGTVYERQPFGGKAFGDILVNDLTGIMRVINNDGIVRAVGTRGNVACLTFYNNWASPPTRLIPWLHMLREPNMAANLTEHGFHTNPVQNQQKMNSEWWRLEAYAVFQSLVRFLTNQFGTDGAQEPPQIGIVTGFVFDNEWNRPINAATITLTGRESGKTVVYTTDCYYSLFYRFPNGRTLSNGFFWVEGFQPGEIVDAVIEADGFQTVTTANVTVPLHVGSTTREGLGFLDVPMLNLMPATVVDVSTRLDLNRNVIKRYPLDIVFSRHMDRASVEAAFSIEAESQTRSQTRSTPNVTLSWHNDYTLRVNISQLEFETTYTITIDGNVAVNSLTGQNLGANFYYTFTTELEAPPSIVSFDPTGSQQLTLRPIVRIEFDMHILPASILPNHLTVVDGSGNPVAGQQTYHAVANGKSVFHFIFDADLNADERYTVTLKAGLQNMNGIPTEKDFVFTFVPRNRVIVDNSPAGLDQFNRATHGFSWGGQVHGDNASSRNLAMDATMRLTAESVRSFRVRYQWTDNTGTGSAGDPSPGLRVHHAAATPTFTAAGNTLTYWVFGDGSNSRVSVILRNPNASGGGHVVNRFIVDWVGWRQISWYLPSSAGTANYLTGSSTALTGAINFGGVNLHAPAPIAERDMNHNTLWFSDLRLVALGEVLNAFLVTFNSQGGSAIPADYYTANVPMDILPTPPTRPGYIFTGWYQDAAGTQPWNFETDVVTGNMTLYAQWREATELYTVTFDVIGNGTLTAEVNDVEITSGDEVLEGNVVTFTATPNDGHRVREWTVNGDVVINNTSNRLTLQVEENVVVTVEFRELDVFTVTFDVIGNGTLTAEVNDVEITSGDGVLEGRTVIFTAIPDNDHRVKEWTVNGDVVTNNSTNTFSFRISANTEVTVEFEEKPSYTVTFDSRGGTSVDPVVVIEGNLIARPADPTRDGCIFTGWRTMEERSNGAGVGNIRSVAGDATPATIIAQLPQHTRINVVEIVMIGATPWGRFEIDLDHSDVVFFGQAGGGTGAADGSGTPGTYVAWASLGVFAVIHTPAPAVGLVTWNFDTHTVTSDMTLIAQWRASEPRTINFHTMCSNVNGTLTASVDGTEITTGDTVLEGREIVFTATPNLGFRVKEWRVNNEVVVPAETTSTRGLGDTKTLTVVDNKVVTVAFEDDGTTGLGNIAFANLQIHPNPFVSEVTITGAQNSVLEIVNALGAVVHTQRITGASETIQLAQLPSGIYFFRVSRDGQSRTLQVVKR